VYSYNYHIPSANLTYKTQYNFDVHRALCLLDVEFIREPKENIYSPFFKNAG